MNEEEALLKGVVAHPTDDLKRLVLADWYEDHGKPLLAEFIRVQVEIGRVLQECAEYKEKENSLANVMRFKGRGGSTLLQRQRALWQEPEVKGHYNSLALFSTFQVLSWDELKWNPDTLVDIPNAIIGLVRRGMVEEVWLPIAQWFHPVPLCCPVCEGTGRVYVYTGHGNQVDEECDQCPTLGKLIVQAHPVTKVWASDKAPLSLIRQGHYGWYDTSHFIDIGAGLAANNLSDEVFAQVSQVTAGRNTYVAPSDYWAWFDSHDYATDALSKALLALANS